jgi:TIR domain/SIR2-like domain
MVQMLDDASWTSLVYGVEQGACTLMLGPNAVTGTIEGERLPVHRALAGFVKDRLGPAFSRLDANKPWTVAQAAVAAEDGRTLRAWVQEFAAKFQVDEEVLSDLAAMPFPLIVNTSPGLAVLQAFRAAKPDTVSDFYDRTAPAGPDIPEPTVGAPVLYGLYGSLENPASMILSESDRLDFVEAVISAQPGLPLKLRNILGDEERSFLFLGFQLGQWQLQLLLHVLGKSKTRAYKSFALDHERDEPDADTQDFFLRGQKINFLSGDLATFVRDLRNRIHAPAPSVRSGPDASRAPVPPDAPTVFICHASEDRAAAERVADQLEDNGIRSWFDRHELIGGDEWDARIRRTIHEDVDYVTVLQSASLLAKTRGYVNREINLAIDRQREYRPPARFVIPAYIDDPANTLDLLDEWQAVDLRADVGQLVRAIRRDVAKRERATL